MTAEVRPALAREGESVRIEEPPMSQERDSPFQTLESGHEFVSLLREAVDEAQGSILDDIADEEKTDGAGRRLETFRLVDHKLSMLRHHVLASLILLNDLRTFAASVAQRAQGRCGEHGLELRSRSGSFAQRDGDAGKPLKHTAAARIP
jgi:hypothetical protein